MDWIKSNPFVAALSGGTLIACILLFFLASKAASRLDSAKEGFDTAFMQVSKYERTELYPKVTNRDAKKKALADYSDSIDQLRSLFDDYRVAEVKPIATQAFTVRLKAANKEVTKAFKEGGTEIPDDFFMGFESYRNKMAESESTGLLDYQLSAVRHALLKLAEARPSEVISVYREPIPEESGTAYEVSENEVARKFGYEVVFKGPETSAREFISALGNVDPYYFIVRAIRIRNEKNDPPRVSDAKFKSLAVEVKESGSADAGFNFFENFQADAVVPEEVAEGQVVPEGIAEQGAEPVQEQAEEAQPADSSKILAQVLGGEELLVFVRFDLTLFSPSENLPKP